MDFRVPLWAVGLMAVLGFVAAIAFASIALHAERGGKRLRWLVQPVHALADLPSLLSNFGDRTRDPYLAPSVQDAVSPPGFWRAPDAADPGYMLFSGAGIAGKPPFAQLVRLSDGKVLREYHPDVKVLAQEAAARATEATKAPGLPFWVGHPDLMDDGGLLFGSSYLLSRVDACARTRWTLPGQHHSIERDADGQIWAPAALPTTDRRGASTKYVPDAITRISPDGKLTFAKPLSRIFDENGLAALHLGKQYSDDPFHLNDIEPVLADGPHWKRGDLFLSLRHVSAVFLYRPATGKILWFRQGPWIGQHDVNILDDHRIAIFDNHSVFTPTGSEVPSHSDELVYDFATDRITAPWSNALKGLNVAANSNGRGTPLGDGSLFVEESNGGRILKIGPGGDVQWRYIHADAKGVRYRLFWSRYLDPVRYGPAIQAALAAKCA